MSARCSAVPSRSALRLWRRQQVQLFGRTAYQITFSSDYFQLGMWSIVRLESLHIGRTTPDQEMVLPLGARTMRPYAVEIRVTQCRILCAGSCDLRARVVHLMGHEFRFAPERAMMARTIADGAIGAPKLATFVSLIPYLVAATEMPPWWFDEEAGGGWLGASSPHLIDWIRFTLGDFDSLSGALATMAPQNGEADDTYVFRFRLKSGLEGVVQQAAASWGPAVDIARVMGTKGSIWLEGQDLKIADANGTRSIPIAADLTLPAIPPLSADPRNQSNKWKWLIPIELPSYIRLCEAFRDLIEGRRPLCPIPLPTFRDGLASMEAIDAVRVSAANGGALVNLKG
jgi:predicted dehydrogenase